MQGQEVTITDMMFCRDRRVQIQNEFIEKYQKPVISFCMNIPGPIKTTPLIRKGFEAGKDALLHALSAADMNVLLTYYKCRDDWEDEKKVTALGYSKVLQGKVKKLDQKYPDKSRRIQKLLSEL